MCTFFGRKIKGRKIKKNAFSAPKTKKKTKFGRPLVKIYTHLYLFTFYGLNF